MNLPPPRDFQLEALSERILRDVPTEAWLELFTQPYSSRIRFRSFTATVLCVRAVASIEIEHEAGVEIMLVAREHGGTCDLLQRGTALLCFEDPASAFQAARLIQELAGGRRFQVGLAQGACDVALVHVQGATREVVLGEAVERARSIAGMAPAGSIRICPHLSEGLQGHIDALAGWLVATEIDAEGVSTVSLALTPRANDMLSSFAGLGLT
ncbi:MAG: hypothetical protein ACXWC2_12975 [Ramlibacter sp.]